MFNPALTTCASERMKTQRFSYFAGFAARELMREAKPVKLKKVGFSHFFDTLRAGKYPALFVRRKPLAWRVVQKRLLPMGKNKTPSVIVEMRSGNCKLQNKGRPLKSE